jgi:hypothetical protein
MKTAPVKTPPKAKPDAVTKLITKSLRLARADAVKTARMHGTAIIYQRDGKLISERP